MENERRGKKQGEGCRVVALVVGAQRSRGRSPHYCPWKSHAHKAVRTWYLNGSRCDASGVANSSYVGQVSRPCAEPRPRRMSRKAFIGSARERCVSVLRIARDFKTNSRTPITVLIAPTAFACPPLALWLRREAPIERCGVQRSTLCPVCPVCASFCWLACLDRYRKVPGNELCTRL